MALTPTDKALYHVYVRDLGSPGCDNECIGFRVQGLDKVQGLRFGDFGIPNFCNKGL